MSLTERQAYLELRARCLLLVAALRSTRNHNPETLAAFERILGPEKSGLHFPKLRFPIDQSTESTESVRHAA